MKSTFASRSLFISHTQLTSSLATLLTHSWFMLQLPTYVTARRFTAPVKCLAQLCEAEGMEPSDMFPEWWTSKRWWRASLRKRKGKKLPYYTGEGATR